MNEFNILDDNTKKLIRNLIEWTVIIILQFMPGKIYIN